MGQISTNDIKPGMKLEIDREPYLVISNEFVKPGKGQAFNRIRVKNMIHNRVVEKTYKSGDKIDVADVEEADVRYLYQEPDLAFFMDEKSFEQISVSMDLIGGNKVWLMEEVVYRVVFYKGSPIDLTPPTFMEMKIKETSPAIRGDTASGRVLKPAVTETGAKIQIPIFIEEGDKVKVDTRTAEYVSRAN